VCVFLSIPQVFSRVRVLSSFFFFLLLSSSFFFALIGESFVLNSFVHFSNRISGKTGLGSAGGDKYLVEGIFFKFSQDSLGLYGGGHFAQKAAALELQALNSVLQASLRVLQGRLRSPLMCLIDYHGYRLVANSLLPIDQNTLVYGSADGGNEVRNSHGDARVLMARLATELNLKAHVVMSRSTNTPVLLHGPVDMEW
jgi:Clustered mitochondria